MCLLSVYVTKSQQGLLVFGIGSVIPLIAFLKTRVNRIQGISLAILGSLFGLLAILGMLQIGPLEKLLFKESVTYRGDYWRAGWRMALENPFFGVGFDQYGDWYRRTRDIDAVLRRGPEFTSNAAHNVLIDFAASAGFLFLLVYLVLVFLPLKAIIQILNVKGTPNPIIVAIMGMWLSYQAQSLISINQIGLAIWGWVTGGALIAYEFSTRSAQTGSTSKSNRQKTIKDNPLISPQMLAGLGMVVGIIIAIPPISGDIKWREAIKAQSAELVTVALTPTYMSPSSSNLYTNAAQTFEQSGLPDLAYKYGKLNTEFNPEYFDGWRILYALKNSTPEDRKLAKENMIRLDPLNEELKKLP